MQVDLTGQVAVVTGAAQGIGRAVAGAFAQSGARVVFTDLDERHTAQAAASVPRLGEPHLSYVMDVANGSEVDAVIARIAEEAGRIDILVNNAGIGVKAADRKTIDEFPVETWEEMLRIDLTGVFRVSRATVPHMKARNRAASSTSRRCSASCRCGCRVPTSPRRLASSTLHGRWRSNWRRTGSWSTASRPGSTATDGWKRWINDAKSEELDLHARLMSHIPLGRPASTAGDRARRALPGGPGQLIHHRPHPSRRRRLDRRLRAGFLRMRKALAVEPRGAELSESAFRCPMASTRTRWSASTGTWCCCASSSLPRRSPAERERLPASCISTSARRRPPRASALICGRPTG